MLTAIKDNGYLDEWSVPEGFSAEGTLKFMEYLKPYFKLSKDCGIRTGCLGYTSMKKLSGESRTNYDTRSEYYKMVLADGTFMWIRPSYFDYCRSLDGGINNSCGAVFFDINGKTQPNTVGKDIFVIVLTKNAAVTNKNDDCYANRSNVDGWGCLSHVLYKGNQDYLH